MLNAQPLIVALSDGSAIRSLVSDDDYNDSDVIRSGANGYKGGWNNLALGTLDFKHLPSQLITSTTKQSLRVGDVCVRLMPIVSKSEECSSIVDIYNTYIAKGTSLIAKTCINRYSGTEELCIPAIPIHTFVSEWNKSLHQFLDMIRSDGLGDNQTERQRRLTVISNVTEIALKNVPILSDHLWFLIHSIVSRPPLVKEVLQLVGSIASTSGAIYHASEVVKTTVPGGHAVNSVRLYLIAKPVPTTGHNVTILQDKAGVTLGLIWVADEEELYDHLRNIQNCYYLHIGTESGNTFRCSAFCEWRYYNYTVFNKMTTFGQELVSKFNSTMLAGNTGDSARVVNRV